MDDTRPKSKPKIGKGLSWVEDRAANESKFKYGPPLFDETNWTYGWRKFKQGFCWGKLQTL